MLLLLLRGRRGEGELPAPQWRVLQSGSQHSPVGVNGRSQPRLSVDGEALAR